MHGGRRARSFRRRDITSILSSPAPTVGSGTKRPGLGPGGSLRRGSISGSSARMMLPYELRALRLCIDRADDELRSRPDDGTSRAEWRAGTRKRAMGSADVVG